MKIFDEAFCRKDKLHNFLMIIDTSEVIIERCENCGKKTRYNKNGGKYDKNKYLRAHLRDTLQPYGRTGKLFREIYGTKSLESANLWNQKFQSEKKRKEEYQELIEKRRFMRRQALKGLGYSDKELEPPKHIKKMDLQ